MNIRVQGDEAAVPATDAVPPKRGATSYALSPREIEVLRLVVDGRSNSEIGGALYISKKTASVHVANIKGKLGAESRIEIVINALALGLVEPPEHPTPGLHALMLRMLDKNQKQPTSPTDAEGFALGAVPGAAPVPAPDGNSASAPIDNQVYRRTFVGRDAELKQVEQAFDGVSSGKGALVMVVGEPGIGKTALSEQLATYVAQRGGRTLVGHCYEEGSLSLPYLAFVEAMRSYVLTRDNDGLRSDLGAGAAEVARIVPEVRERIPGIELRPDGDPADDRWRLLQSVTSFLRTAAFVQPLVVVLEDLHWADRGTLDLLLHVARNLQGARLLLVGTYRDVEVDRAHPLSATLADLRRVGMFDRVTLRGLTVDEVHRMLSTLGAQEARWAVAEAVHRQTEGNPLFIQEVFRYLSEEGLIGTEGGRLRSPGSTPPEMSIPEGLRDVIGKRLSRLSVECNRLLSIAAVIGRDFDIETLRLVGGMSEDELLSGIEQAVRVGVLEERPLPGTVRYRFAHAFFRQTLYEETIAPRRLRLHQQVARALEAQYSTRRAEHAAELAEHFGQSTDLTDLTKAISYSELAAQRAMSVYAFGEAAGHLERCLAVQDVLDPDDELRRCDLLLALGDALAPAGDPYRAVEDAADEAERLAERLGDRQRAFRAVEIAFSALFRYGGLLVATLPEYQEWLERVSRLNPSSPEERIVANCGRAIAYYATGKAEQFHVALAEALDLATQIDSQPSRLKAAWFLAILPAGPSREAARQRLVDEVLEWPSEGVSRRTASSVLAFCGLSILTWGDRSRAESLWRGVDEMARRTDDPGVTMVNLTCQLLLQSVDGHLEKALATSARLIALAEESAGSALDRRKAGDPIRRSTATAEWRRNSFTALMHLGRWEEAGVVTDKLKEFRDQGQVPLNAHFALYEARLGRPDEASRLLSAFLSTGQVSDAEEAELTIFLQAALLLGDKDAARVISHELTPVADDALTIFDHTCVARHLGGASSLLGNAEEARAYYDRALAVAMGIRFRPEIALTRLALAELLLERYPDEAETAIGHLDFAIGELRDMKMQPALERALSRREMLPA